MLTYIEAVSPTIKTVEINEIQSQNGYEVTMNKIEFAEDETRLYITVKNNGNSVFHLYKFNIVILQDENQFNYQASFDSNYPELNEYLYVGAKTEGIIILPNMEIADLKIIAKGTSDNYNEKFQDFVWNVTIAE